MCFFFNPYKRKFVPRQVSMLVAIRVANERTARGLATRLISINTLSRNRLSLYKIK